MVIITIFILPVKDLGRTRKYPDLLPGELEDARVRSEASPEHKHVVVGLGDRVAKLSDNVLLLKPGRTRTFLPKPAVDEILRHRLACAREAVPVEQSRVQKDPEHNGKPSCFVQVVRVGIRAVRGKVADESDTGSDSVEVFDFEFDLVDTAQREQRVRECAGQKEIGQDDGESSGTSASTARARR